MVFADKLFFKLDRNGHSGQTVNYFILVISVIKNILRLVEFPSSHSGNLFSRESDLDTSQGPRYGHRHARVFGLETTF